jgi:hypothetical protein
MANESTIRHACLGELIRQEEVIVYQGIVDQVMAKGERRLMLEASAR